MDSYRPLDRDSQEIRLLVVEPGSEPEMVHCSFLYHRLKDPQEQTYETISYAWSDSSIRALVKLEGRQLDVPASSERALCRFRYSDQQRILWIDAICINQADLDERSNQVNLMYEIYSNPSRNLVWLGESNETTSTALQAVSKLEQDMVNEVGDQRKAFELLHTYEGIERQASHGFACEVTTEELDALSRLATDARDHIFGVLGLARRFGRSIEGYSDLIVPDYSKTVARAFQDAAFYSILEDEDLVILLQLSYKPSLPGLPSWVPDWGQPFNPGMHPNSLRPNLYHAAPQRRLNMNEVRKSRENELNVSGIVIARVERCSRVLDNYIIADLTRIEPSLSMLQKVGLGAVPSLTRRDDLELAVTLTAGCNHLEQVWEHSDLARHLDACQRVFRHGQKISSLPELTAQSTEDERLVAEFHQALYAASINRRVFTTSSHRLGLGPPLMNAGDFVVILYGCELPVILRHWPGSDHRFEFIGTCYTNGIMNGEAVGEHQAAGREDAHFTLV